MKIIQQTGLVLFIASLLIFLSVNGLDRYRLVPESLGLSNIYHQQAILEAARQSGMLGKTYASSFSFHSHLKKIYAPPSRHSKLRLKAACPKV